MTLFKQLFAGTSIAFLVVLAATEGIYVKNAHKFLQEQLVSHSQDAATSLGMVLPASMADGDLIRAEVTVNAMFDRGYYQSIRVLDTKGETLLLKTLAPAPAGVPQWFVKALPLEMPVAESLISKGWQQMGRVVVSSHPNFAYKQLWRTLVEATLGLAAMYLLALLALHKFLSRILRPLHDIETVARAISKRDFQQVRLMPRTRELRSVVNAINSMSAKLRAIIDDEVRQANRCRDESNKDLLTGLDNRRGFESHMQSLLDDNDLRSGVMYLLQIANFQQFNDSNGFQKGDAFLKALGDALISIRLGQHLLRARLNGPIFAVVAFNVSRESAMCLGEELSAALSAVIDAQIGQTGLLFGSGGAYFSDQKVTLSALLAQCDLAMLQSQTSGHSLNVLQDLAGDDDEESKGSQFWKKLILDALQGEHLVLLSQSVMGMKDSRQMQVEVVGRLKNSQGEMISAGQFIPMANRHGLTPMLDLAVLRKLIDIMQSKLSTSEQVAINLSIHSIHDRHMLGGLMAVLRDNPGVSRRLVFEFTEFCVVHDLDGIEQFVADIRKLGAEFAVDNFGLHHSAFEYLQKLKPAYVKLSPVYLHELQCNYENQFFVSSVVRITHSLEIKVIALGVEGAGVLALLQQLGVDGYQGYVSGALQELM